VTAISAPLSDVRAPAGPVEHHKFIRALEGRIEPVRVGPAYQLGLLLAAATMLLLPLVYLALVGLVSFGVYYHAVEDITIFEGRGNAKGKFIAYVAPLVVGIILVLFMIKPLFAKRARGSAPIALSRANEPLLFAFVERLCDVVGAPKPTAIRVDTQVKRVGQLPRGHGRLPPQRPRPHDRHALSAAGLTMRQLAGVLAHEFGHFAQGTGMRLTFIVRSINHWFARVVYERDAWDEWLDANVARRRPLGHHAAADECRGCSCGSPAACCGC
jgi:hypothetical protein